MQNVTPCFIARNFEVIDKFVNDPIGQDNNLDEIKMKKKQLKRE